MALILKRLERRPVDSNDWLERYGLTKYAGLFADLKDAKALLHDLETSG
jgi:hypothetical protein